MAGTRRLSPASPQPPLPCSPTGALCSLASLHAGYCPHLSARRPDWIDNWSGLERTEYERKKEEVADAIVARLERVFPGLKEAIILR